MNTFFIYILKCNDGSYYTGHTDNLAERLVQHQRAFYPYCYTASRLPIELLHQQSFYSREEALLVEQQIKGWNRKKKQALINNDWDEISKLAKSFSTHSP